MLTGKDGFLVGIARGMRLTAGLLQLEAVKPYRSHFLGRLDDAHAGVFVLTTSQR